MDALISISHYLQTSLATGMESYIVQLGFGAAFNRVSRSGPLFKLKSIGVDGCVLSICSELLSNHRQRVVVDGDTTECMDPNRFWRATRKCVGSSSVHPLYK